MKDSGEHDGTPAGTAKRPYHRKQPAPFQRSRIGANGSRQHHNDQRNGMIVYSNHQHQRNPSTLSNFCQSMLRISSLHILQAAGYDAVQANPMSVLADCLGRYLEFLAESAKEFAQLSGRSQITAFDVADGLSDLGIELSDLKVWLMENGGEAIITPVSAAGQNSHHVNGETTITTPGTVAAAAGPNAANRPVLPSWKGADPGRVINDLLWNGRRRDTEGRAVYEWHAVQEGFVMPETEEEQDEFAYPEASDDEATEDRGAQQAIAPARQSKWIPELKPSYIPDYLPPFPGAAVVGDLLDAEEEDRISEFRNNQSADVFDRSMSIPPSSTTDVLAATDSPVHSEMAKLSISTTQQAVVDSSMQNGAKSDEVTKQDDVNPYTHVVPFLESALPTSTLYAAIPAKSTSKSSTAASPRQSRPKSTGLSQESQHLFSDTLLTLLDPVPYQSAFTKRHKSQSELARVLAKPGEQSDTLFSNTQHVGMIDDLLRQSGPSAIMSKFTSPGVSVQDGLSPIVSSERVTNGGYSDYHPVPDPLSAGGRSSMVTGGSRKGSFSSSPLSTVSYPPKDNAPGPSASNGLLTNLSGSVVRPKSVSRKSSIADAGTPSQIAQLQSSTLMTYSSQGTTGSSLAGSNASSAPINPSILSRIGSNFDPAALLAAHGSNGANHSPIVNGVSGALATTPLASTPPAPAAPIASSGVKNLSAFTSSLPITAPSSSIISTAPTTQQQLSTKSGTVSKPTPGPISLSDWPLSISTSAGASVVKTPSTATTATTTMPSLQQSAPKIRFKFSAISSGDLESTSSSSSKREHGSSSSSHHHRSSSITSLSGGSSHHKKSKRSSREYDFEGDEDDEDSYAREKKKKKKNKSKDRDRDRDRDHDRDRSKDRDRGRDRDSDGGGASSSRHKQHKHYSHPRHDDSSSGVNGSSTYSGSSAPSISSHVMGAGYGYGGYHAAVADSGDQSEVINCICSNPTLDDGLFMIACDKCQEWFHGRCVGVRESDSVATWFCRRCTASGRA